MADEKLVEELAEHLAERDGRRSLFTDGLDAIERAYRDEYRRTARVALEWLAERGRLVPDGSKVREIPGVRLTWPDGKVEEFQCIQPGAALACVAHHREKIAAGLTRLASAELLSRKQITTPWVPVGPAPEETT